MAGKSFSRRDFLKYTALSTLAMSIPLDFAEGAENQPHMLFVSSKYDDKTGFASRINLADDTVSSIPLDFIVHSYSPMPGQPGVVLGMEKWGSHAALIDFDQQRIVKSIKSPDGTIFQGHGVHVPAQSAFLVPYFDVKKESGHVIALDDKTFEPKFSYQVSMGMLHECHLAQDGTLLLACSGMSAPYEPNSKRYEPASLKQVDAATGKIISVRAIDDPAQNITHFNLAKNGALVVLTRPEGKEELWKDGAHGDIYLGHMDTPGLKKIDVGSTGANNKTLNGEMFSAAIDSDGRIAAVTNYASSTLYMIDLVKGEVIRQMNVEDVRGVSYNALASRFIISGKTGISLVSADGQMQSIPATMKTDRPLQKLFGSHNLLV